VSDLLGVLIKFPFKRPISFPYFKKNKKLPDLFGIPYSNL
jgi:hypothetical protein